MSPTLIGIIVLAGVGVYIISVYNGLQALKTQIQASIQEIGNQLKRQASLLPNLENAVKSYMKHEKGVFQMLTDARKSVAKANESGKASDIDAAIEKIQAAVPQIAIAVEDNPEMKADATVTKFMDELRDTADKLMYARRSVIDLTQAYNVRLVTFPSNLVAKLFGFKAEKGMAFAQADSHLSVSDSEAQDYKSTL
ncbi:MAG TPA: LemA family protein [Patescibacteria group bacterium]